MINNQNIQTKQKTKGFTLAEVLITLAIIGVISSILLPSILANYTEKTLKAKRQAFIARMSQAMGEMADTFRNYESVTDREKTAAEETSGYTPDCSAKSEDCSDNGSALKFVNEGLSKVYKIAAVCDNNNLSACDIPEKITMQNGKTFPLIENGQTFLSFNREVTTLGYRALTYDLNSAGIMTKNGESVLLFYNPNCMSKSVYPDTDIYGETTMCVNMVYDLNGGKNKPNKVGEDIGFLTSFYSDMPYVVSPKPYDWKAVPDFSISTEAGVTTKANLLRTFDEAKAACAALGSNVSLPSLEELMSMAINREIWAPIYDQVNPVYTLGEWAWSSTMTKSNQAWQVYWVGNRVDNNIYVMLRTSVNEGYVRCVYKD